MNKKKRLLVVVPSIGIGGRERIAISTADCLQEQYDTKLVIFQRKDNEYSADCEMIHMDYPAQRSVLSKLLIQIKRSMELIRIRNELSIDIVYSLGMTANISNALSGLFSKGKTIIAIHGFAEVKRSLINSFVLKHAAKVVCISQEMQYQLLKLYPDLQNTVVIENGYDLDAMNKDHIAKHLFNEKAPRFVAMGRLNAVKRYDILLKAFQLVCVHYPGAILSILGYGEKETDLKRLAAELGISEQVNFLGYQESPYKYLKENDIFLLTSKNEGFPNALIEGLACGLAVVSVDCLSGPREILSDQYTPEPVEEIVFEKYGVLVENNKDSQQLIQLISRAVLALLDDKEKMNDYQRIGIQRANCFSLDTYCKKICTLFENLN